LPEVELYIESSVGGKYPDTENSLNQGKSSMHYFVAASNTKTTHFGKCLIFSIARFGRY
jgi:hypothetical protein